VGLAVPLRAKSCLVNLNCQSGEAICTFAALCRCAAVPLARAGMFVGEIVHIASSSRTLPDQAQYCQQSSLRKLCNHWKTFSALATHQTCTELQITSHFLCTVWDRQLQRFALEKFIRRWPSSIRASPSLLTLSNRLPSFSVDDLTLSSHW
jgi:hypothetical protein